MAHFVSLLGEAKKHLPWQVFFLAATFVAYCLLVWPALAGGFVLDDWPNLDPLQQVRISGDIWAYSMSGVASSLGRPLAYLSFAVQADDWPENPAAFKLVNLYLHLFNAFILFWACRALVNLRSPDKKIRFWCPIAIAVVWLILPIHMSSVFYVVQRMTLLSASFTLLGVWAFLSGYTLSRRGALSAGLLLAAVGAGVGYLGGILSKETGVNLGVFLGVTYLLLPTAGTTTERRLWRIWVVLVALMPLVLTAIYLYFKGGYHNGYSIRDFTMVERLMTEPLVLWDYSRNILVPSASSLNVYNDDFPVARDFGGRAAVGLLAWLLLLCCVWRLKTKMPLLGAGVLWFVGGHLLESSILPLELYFEHRNYLPSIGWILILVGLFSQAARYISCRLTGQGLSVASLVLVGLVLLANYSWLLKQEARVWSEPRLFAMASIMDRPGSLRAWQDAASYFGNQGDYKSAAAMLHQIEVVWPGMQSTLMSRVLLSCLDGNVLVPEHDEQLLLLRIAELDRGVGAMLHQVLNVKKQGACDKLSWPQYRELVEAVLVSKSARAVRQNAVILLSYSFNAEQKFKEAVKVLGRFSEQRAGIDFLLLKVRFYIMAGDLVAAKALLLKIRVRFEDNRRVWLPNRAMVGELDRLVNQPVETERGEIDD